MEHKIIVTNDNSKTLLIPELNETYHSTKGALTEALHVFIKEGLQYSNKSDLAIFEMGFGTGLNAILTLKEAIASDCNINYHCIEAYPLAEETIKNINYLEELNLTDLVDFYNQMHLAENGKQIQLTSNFFFTKYLSKIQEQKLPSEYFDLIFYDAFGPKVQPELWQKPVLEIISKSMKSGSVLTTYCAQGAFKRNLKEIGFSVESIPGPPGKREMTRALKNF